MLTEFGIHHRLESYDFLSSIQLTLGVHTDARRRITNIFGGIPCSRADLMNLVAQLSDRIHHFTVSNLMPLAFLTKSVVFHESVRKNTMGKK